MASQYSERALDALRRNRKAISAVLAKYAATNPRLFGSVVEGQAAAGHWRQVHGCDDARLAELIRADRIDILVDLLDGARGSRLSRLAGIRIELEELLQLQVDVAYEGLLKDDVSESVRKQLVAL